MISRFIDYALEPSGLPEGTLSQALVPCCDLRCRPASTCATDHHGPERERYNRRIWGTEQPYTLDDDERVLARRLRGDHDG